MNGNWLRSAKKIVKQFFPRRYIRVLKRVPELFWKDKREIDSLYSILHQLVNRLDETIELFSQQTADSFSRQWLQLPAGDALLSDEYFRTNVQRIICEEELLIKPEWFKGKWVLDAGCGNGRWSYGLAKLGANVTAVDINQTAIDFTRKALENFPVEKEFIVSPLEALDETIVGRKYDLVFSWGVLHHCRSFLKALASIAGLVSDTGLIYLYLYGQESMSVEDDLELFKERIYYNSLQNWELRHKFLMKKAQGNPARVHMMHDCYSPLINRRLEYETVHDLLRLRGFDVIERTIQHTELFIRAYRREKFQGIEGVFLPRKQPPFWFERYPRT